MTRPLIKSCLAGTLCGLLLACGGNQAPGAPDGTGHGNEADERHAAARIPVEQAESDGLTIDQQIAGAVDDLAGRLGISADAVAVREARAVNWGSSAIGCPQPGLNYTQALVPGIRVLLQFEASVHRYHGRIGKSLFLCPEERAEAPAYGRGEEVM